MNHPNLSPELLAELKQNLEERKVELKKQLEVLGQEDSFEDPDRVYVDNAEDADEAQEDVSHLENELKEDSAEDVLGEVEKAIAKMDRGEYGVCEVCNSPIDIERLKAYPEAETCIKHTNGE